MAITRSSERDLLLPGLAEVIGKYPQIPTQWSNVFSRATSKMAVERSAEMRYTGLAQLKSEGGATVFDNAAGERFVYAIEMTALGLGFAMTREAMDDNLYKDEFGPQAMGLTESFAQTKEIICANVLNSATVYNSSIVGDTVSLVNTAHPIDSGTWANRPSPDLDLNEAAIEFALQQIRIFPDQANLRMLARGQKLIVPINLEFTAERLTKAELRPSTANNDITAFLSSGGLPGGYQVMDFLTSSYAWFVQTSIQKPGKGLIYYDRIPFELDMQVDPITGNLMVIGYERYGAGYNQPRAIWGSFPTS
jgi:hypothetical protein